MLIIEFVTGRSGSAVFALRYYEPEGLIIVGRNAGEQSRLERADIRRLSFIRIVQLSRSSLLKLKCNLMSCLRRAPKKLDLVRPSCGFRAYLNARITALEDLLDRLNSCIGCGCLSLATCELYHPDDIVAQKGAGPCYLM